jgi:hypothetical protein
MLKISLPNRDHKNGNGRGKSDLTGADHHAGHAPADAEMPPLADTEQILKAETVALKADVDRAVFEGKQKSNHLIARIADLKHRLEMFERNVNQ